MDSLPIGPHTELPEPPASREGVSRRYSRSRTRAASRDDPLWAECRANRQAMVTTRPATHHPGDDLNRVRCSKIIDTSRQAMDSSVGPPPAPWPWR